MIDRRTTMDFVLPTPSLEHLAGVKVLATLWNQRDIIARMKQSLNGTSGYYLGEYSKKWKAIEDVVRSNISALPLPQQCRDRLLNFFKPLATELVDWCHYHSGELKLECLGTVLPRQFCWTMHGTIDYKRTAELMAKDDGVSMQRRLEFACVYGLEDEAVELIELVPEEGRHGYYENTLRGVMKNEFYHLIVLIADTINVDGIDVWNKWSPFHCVWTESFHNKYQFREHLPSGNRAMCEYLFETLEPEEQEQILNDCQKLIVSCRDAPTCSLLYYLSLMSEEQRDYMFRKGICGLLVCLLRWPAQSLFMKAVEGGWQFMNPRECSIVLLAITLKIRLDFRDYDYRQLFWECWRLIPAEDAVHVLHNDALLLSLLLTEADEFIKLVFIEGPSHIIFDLYRVWTDQSAISESEKNDVEKRKRSEYLREMIDLAMKSRGNIRI